MTINFIKRKKEQFFKQFHVDGAEMEEQIAEDWINLFVRFLEQPEKKETEPFNSYQFDTVVGNEGTNF